MRPRKACGSIQEQAYTGGLVVTDFPNDIDFALEPVASEDHVVPRGQPQLKGLPVRHTRGAVAVERINAANCCSLVPRIILAVP
jgi:hypothetical protein